MKVLTYIAIVTLLQTLAHAQWNMNPRINTQVAAHNQKYNVPGGTYQPYAPFHRMKSGQFLVHWSVGVYPGARYGVIADPVYAQLINPDGRNAWPGWGVALVDSSFSNAQHSYDVLVSDSDSIFVFYHRNTYRSDTNEIYSQLYVQQFNINGRAVFPAGGKLISSGVYRNNYLSEKTSGPISVQTADNAFTVVFSEYAYMQGGYHYRMRMQRVDGSGRVYYGPEGIAATPWLRQWGGASVAPEALFADGNGGVSLFYTAFDNYRSHVFMQRVDSNGVTRWPDKGRKVNPNAYTSVTTQVARTTDDCYTVVIAQKDTINPHAPDNWQLYAQKIDSAGNDVWGAGQVEVFPLRNLEYYVHRWFAPDQSGGVYIVGGVADTGSNSFSYKGRTLRVQRIDGTGRLCFGLGGVSIEPTSYEHSADAQNIPQIIPDGIGGAILAYVYRAPGGKENLDEDIKGQRIDSTGRKLWGDSGVYISSADSSQKAPTLIADGQGGAVVVWTDYRNVTFVGLPPVRRSEIYATRISPNGNAYPVEFASFTARMEGEQVRLDWRTESETNNAGFEVERAIPPSGPLAGAYEAANWQRIGYVLGNGSTNVSQSYMYHDALTPELLGQSELLYRLRQIDYDGTHEYSPVARVLVNPPTAVSLEAIYPNPAQGSALLRFALPSEQPVRLALYDVLGREALLVHEGSLPTGVHAYDAHLDQLPAGLYHVLLTTPLGRQARRMVVVR